MNKPKALVTAPFRGAGLELLESLCSEVVLDPWIDHRPLRLYNSEQLAARIVAEGANLLVVESDSVKGPVLELPLAAETRRTEDILEPSHGLQRVQARQQHGNFVAGGAVERVGAGQQSSGEQQAVGVAGERGQLGICLVAARDHGGLPSPPRAGG